MDAGVCRPLIGAYCEKRDLPEARYVFNHFFRGISVQGHWPDRGARPQIAIGYGVEPPFPAPCTILIPRRMTSRLDEFGSFLLSQPCDPRLTDRALPILSDSIAPLNGDTPFVVDSHGSVLATRQGDRIVLAFDLIFNAFAWLSCLREWREEQFHSPCHGTAPVDREIDFKLPAVDMLFAFLEGCIRKYVPTFSRTRKGWGVILTHDVDYFAKPPRLRIRQAGVHAFNSVRSLLQGRMAHSWKCAWKAVTFPWQEGNYRQLIPITELERRFGATSTFYLFAKTDRSGQTSMQRRIDPTYDISDPALRELLREVETRGWDLGLHGSSQTFEDVQLLQEECDQYRRILGNSPRTIRLHWLRFSQRRTWATLLRLGFSADATMGWNDRLGFRTGSASPHLAFDHEKRQPLPILVVPTPIMDGTLFQHLNLDDDRAWEECRRILVGIRDFNGFASINWHQRTIAPDYGWYPVYERILGWLQEHGGRAHSMKEYLSYDPSTFSVLS